MNLLNLTTNVRYKVKGALACCKTFVLRAAALLCVLFWGYKRDVQRKFSSSSGQGTTEYAILVGVLVVIAIIAIVAFKPTLENLWTSIKQNILSLGS